MANARALEPFIAHRPLPGRHGRAWPLALNQKREPYQAPRLPPRSQLGRPVLRRGLPATKTATMALLSHGEPMATSAVGHYAARSCGCFEAAVRSTIAEE